MEYNEYFCTIIQKTFTTMVLQIPITEAVSLIKTKTGKNVDLSIVNNNTVKVVYELKVKVPIFGDISKNVDLDVSIEKIQDETLYLQYTAGGIGIDMILKGIFTALPTFSNKRVIETTDGCRLKVNLDEIDEARKALNQIKVNNITFSNGNAVVDFNVKN